MKKFVFKINKKEVFKVVFLLIIIFLSGFFTYKVLSNKENINIDKILSSEYYSYLPKEAKNYIKEVYEETGEVILTEKNKEVNKPYLSSKYINYITLSVEEKKQVSVVPDVYSIDYVFSDGENNTEKTYPAKYDLRNVDGKSYISPLKDQGQTGLCWAFSAVEQVESFLMVNNKAPYSKDSQLFSVRQLDYAISTNGIENYNNPFGRRALLGGGNFEITSEIMSYGLSLVDEKNMVFNESNQLKKLSEVHNFDNSMYEITSTVEIPQISDTTMLDPNYKNQCLDIFDADLMKKCFKDLETKLKNEYFNEIKKNIINNGGGVISTISPQSACSFKNDDGYYVTELNDGCYSALYGHAMHIIGWDDNYEYSYCKTRDMHYNVIDGECETGTLVEGTGAWLIRNSWGESEYAFNYITYDSFPTIVAPDVSFITSMNSIEDKGWDNFYSNNVNYNQSGTKNYTNSTTQKFQKELDGQEKLEKLKFIIATQNANFNVVINANGNSYTETVSADFPGLYTLDLSSKEIVLNDSEISITISSEKSLLINESISIYTSNETREPVVKTEAIIADSPNFAVYSQTKNIDSGESISYELYDGETKLEDYLFIEDNIVAANNVNTILTIKKKLEKGNYKLKISYGEYEFYTNLNLTKSIKHNGLGTEDSPYLITNETELFDINSDLNAYYKLENDIVLSNDWVPIGTQENPFTGCLDGQGFKIINLKISGENLTSSGLFAYVSNSSEKENYIKNINIPKANIKGKDNTAVLIGTLINNDYKYNILIDSIYLVDGEVIGDNVGALVGLYIDKSYKDNIITINNIFSSVTLKANKGAAFFGDVQREVARSTIEFSNIQNIGIINVTDTTSPISNFTNFFKTNHVMFSINNFLMNGYIKYNDGIYGKLVNYHTIRNGINGYSLKEKNEYIDHTNEENNVYSFTSILDFKDDEKYKDWDNFDKYWNTEPVDGIKRIPILKGVNNFEYTKVSKIELFIGEEELLTDFITPLMDEDRLVVTIKDDEDIVRYNPINKSLTGLKPGKTTIHLINNYDGYENDVEITVLGKEKPMVYYYSNYNNGGYETNEQTTYYNTNFKLDKNTFSLRGYIFKEWNTKEDGSGISYNDEEELNGLIDDLTLYAQWTPINYKIIYNPNGGIGTMESQIFTFDVIQQLKPNTFTRKGFDFVKWSIQSDGKGVSYQNEQNIKNLTSNSDEEITLYAIWEKQTHSVTFDANGGTGTMSAQPIGELVPTKLDKNSFTRTGYNFIGWNTKSDGTGSSYADEQEINISKDLVLYAQWTLIKYTVNFDANGGTFKENKITLIVEDWEDSMIDTMEKPTREGYIFKGFFTEKEGGTSLESYIAEAGIDKEGLVFYAQWEEMKIEIKDYKHDIENNYITHIIEKTNVTTYKTKFKLPSNHVLKVYDKENKELKEEDLIFTGSITKILKDDKVVYQYINVVRGDVNGTGTVTVADVSLLYSYIRGTTTIKEKYYLVAGDVNDSLDNTVVDVSRIYSFVRKGISLF